MKNKAQNNFALERVYIELHRCLPVVMCCIDRGMFTFLSWHKLSIQARYTMCTLVFFHNNSRLFYLLGIMRIAGAHDDRTKHIDTYKELRALWYRISGSLDIGEEL